MYIDGQSIVSFSFETQNISNNALSDEQKSAIETILARYNNSELNEEDAKAIVRGFKAAGIRPSEELRNLIEKAGFNADEIKNLATESENQGQAVPKSYLAQDASLLANDTVNQAAMEKLQSILNKYPSPADLTEVDRDNLFMELSDAGLLERGAFFSSSV